MNEIELAWAAGLFEGEGSVRINGFRPNALGALSVELANCDMEIIEFFRARWGGAVRTAKLKPPRRQAYYWRLAARQAAAFLEELRPYLRTARYRARADLAIVYQFQKVNSRENRTPAYRDRQQAFYEEMAALNIRGSAAL